VGEISAQVAAEPAGSGVLHWVDSGQLAKSIIEHSRAVGAVNHCDLVDQRVDQQAVREIQVRGWYLVDGALQRCGLATRHGLIDPASTMH
jgi:hypothetical protein